MIRILYAYSTKIRQLYTSIQKICICNKVWVHRTIKTFRSINIQRSLGWKHFKFYIFKIRSSQPEIVIICIIWMFLAIKYNVVSILFFLIMYICTCVKGWICALVISVSHPGQQRALDHLELWLQLGMSCTRWMLWMRQ